MKGRRTGEWVPETINTRRISLLRKFVRAVFSFPRIIPVWTVVSRYELAMASSIELFIVNDFYFTEFSGKFVGSL